MPTLPKARNFAFLALFALLIFGSVAPWASAQEEKPQAVDPVVEPEAVEPDAVEPEAIEPPHMELLYLANPSLAPFQFQMPGHPKMLKNVGSMPFASPNMLLPGLAIEPTLRTYCLEPKVPIYSGNVYEFALEDPSQPKYFDLPDTDEGRAEARRRMSYIGELYGRFYQETLDNPELTEPAFQIALWELAQERTVPEGPMPFNLYTGDFQANYPNEVDAPAYVRLGQTYVQSLTGNDESFATNPATAGQSLVRLTGVASANGVAAQSQLMLQAPPSAAAALGGGNGPQGGLGGQPTGVGGAFAPAGGFGPAGGLGSGLGAGGLGGFPFVGGLGNGTTQVSTTPITAPSIPGPNTGTGPSTRNPSGGQGGQTDDDDEEEEEQGGGGGENPNNNPVPAPPALVLGAVAIGLFAARRRWLKARPA